MGMTLSPSPMAWLLLAVFGFWLAAGCTLPSVHARSLLYATFGSRTVCMLSEQAVGKGGESQRVSGRRKKGKVTTFLRGDTTPFAAHLHRHAIQSKGHVS